MTRFTLTSQELAKDIQISLSTLRRYRKEKFFLPGRHFLPIGIGRSRPRLKWDPAEVTATLELKARRSVMQ